MVTVSNTLGQLCTRKTPSLKAFQLFPYKHSQSSKPRMLIYWYLHLPRCLFSDRHSTFPIHLPIWKCCFSLPLFLEMHTETDFKLVLNYRTRWLLLALQNNNNNNNKVKIIKKNQPEAFSVALSTRVSQHPVPAGWRQPASFTSVILDLPQLNQNTVKSFQIYTGIHEKRVLTPSNLFSFLPCETEKPEHKWNL